MEWGWVPFFMISLAVLKGRGQKSADKKGTERKESWQQKIKVNFVLGIWPRGLNSNFKQSLRRGVMFQNMKYAFL